MTYAKKPFAGPEQVLEYLARYTHRIALSNNRIKSVTDDRVTFEYRDRRDNGKKKEMTLDANEFIRRFLLHVLPKGFVKIRYFGFLSHRRKKEAIETIRILIDREYESPEKREESIKETMLRLTVVDITICPRCKKGKMKKIREIDRLPHAPVRVLILKEDTS